MNKKKEAFTLIELIIVIAILALLAAVAIPRYNKSKINAEIAAHKTNVSMLKSAAEMRILDEDKDIKWPEEDDYKLYLDKWPSLPKGLSSAANSPKEYSVKYIKGSENIEISPGLDEFD